MQIFTRAKNMLLSPATEWRAVAAEKETPQSLLGKYVFPMALIPAIALYFGYGWGFGIPGTGTMTWGLIMGLNSLISSILSYFICTYVVDALAPNFSSPKDIGRSAQLVAYANTAVWVAGIFSIFPSLSILGILGLYSIYLFYLGIPVMKHTPEDKRVTYMVVCAIVIILIGIVIRTIITRIIFAISGYPLIGGYGMWHF
jgi:Yip1 domain